MKARKSTPGALPKSAESYSCEHNFSVDVQSRIRQRAYELYVERGRVDGSDLDDWLRAEAEVLQTKQKAATA